MKCVSFNIRCDYGQDGINNFVYRAPYILKKIQYEQPDFICFQEILPHVGDWLKENLSSYYILGCGRDCDLKDEQTAIAFKKKDYQLIRMETFWLSPTPYVPGTRYKDQSICPRTCTEVMVQHLKTGQIVRILNTHLDHEGSKARFLAVEQILNYIKNQKLFSEVPVILVGDFNALPSSQEIEAIKKDGLLTDLTAHLEGTYHEYGQLESPKKIDYVFATKNVEVRNYELWKGVQEGVYLSDHYPVCVEVMIRW